MGQPIPRVARFADFTLHPIDGGPIDGDPDLGYSPSTPPGCVAYMQRFDGWGWRQ